MPGFLGGSSLAGDVKKVVDCSGMESAELAQMLAASPSNFAVLSDFCAMEAFSRGTKAQALFQILARHPGQTLVLKTTAEISRLRPRAKGLLNRLIDNQETNDFVNYATAVANGNDQIIAHLAEKRNRAKVFLGDLVPAAEALQRHMLEMFKTYTDSDLHALRSEKRVTERFARRIETDVAQETRLLLNNIFGAGRLPRVPDVKYSFPFRFAVCHFALATHWASTGGLHSLPAKNFRNDINDCNCAAHATFFDGLITRDDRLTDVFNLSVKLLRAVFGMHTLTARETSRLA